MTMKDNELVSGERNTMENNFIDDDWSPPLAATRPPPTESAAPRLVPLPTPPKSTSPVPWLTSIHATPGRGNYGDPKYRGNCSGLIIRDLLMYYRPRRVLDPMSGGGTCRDVCRELNIDCHSLDIRSGHDATNPAAFWDAGSFDFIWLHPPYWKLIRWSEDPRCLANAPTRAEFLRRLRAVIRNCRRPLRPRGILAILIGDLREKGEYQALPFRTLNVAYAEGFVLAAPEIIRFSHGTTSAKHSEYPFSLIPRLHDMCLLLKQGRPK